MDPLSITLAALSAKAGEAILTGIIGNRSDYLLVNSFQKIKQIITSRNKEFPENHDLLRTLRKSMLTATDMIRISMKVDGEQKDIGPGDAVDVPSGAEHNFINIGPEVMKLYTVYAPAEHPDGTVHATKAEAEAAEAKEQYKYIK